MKKEQTQSLIQSIEGLKASLTRIQGRLEDGEIKGAFSGMQSASECAAIVARSVGTLYLNDQSSTIRLAASILTYYSRTDKEWTEPQSIILEHLKAIINE